MSVIEKFGNTELKRTSIMIAFLACIFAFVTFFITSLSFNNIKKSYIRNNMAFLGMVASNTPELKDKAVSIVTKGVTKKDVEVGKKVLKSYDYSEDLNIGLIGEINNSYTNFLKILLFFEGLFFISFFTANYFGYSKIYKKLDNLIVASKRLLDYDFDIDIYDNAEGTLPKLSYAFEKMRIVMKKNFLEMNNEKIFLVDLLSDISHQIKTPIASLIIYNDILLNRKLSNDERINFLERSKEQLYRIEWLVKSLLKLARIDAKAIKFEKKNCDLNKTCLEAVESLKINAQKRKVRLEFCKSLDDVIMPHDRNWIKECLINIIKNSIEHNKEGGFVKICLKKTTVSIRITIEDNGEGIMKKDIPHIFERFYKGMKNSNAESVGIGLALAKSIVEGHGGTIDVKSEYGKGTAFKITFLRYNIN